MRVAQLGSFIFNYATSNRKFGFEKTYSNPNMSFLFEFKRDAMAMHGMANPNYILK
jgi:hypothetical protein